MLRSTSQKKQTKQKQTATAPHTTLKRSVTKKSTKQIRKVTKRTMATTTSPVHDQAQDVLAHFNIRPEHPGIQIGLEEIATNGRVVEIKNPTTGKVISTVKMATADDYKSTVRRLEEQRTAWALYPAPKRGEIVRQIGDALRKEKHNLAKIISMEMGKIYQEALGEVQEGIDICDYAVGLSRQVGGNVFPSERGDHIMMERYQPHSGNVAVITAFNFPCAVFFWNASLSLVMGNTQILKPAPSGSLIAIASSKIVHDVLAKNGFANISALYLGEGDVGSAISNDHKNSLVSFTGSTHVGRQVSVDVAKRFGRSILELGGNNAMFVFPDADLNMAVRSALFSAVGTCGQRCTSLRRLYIHEEVYDQFVEALEAAYTTVQIGDPLIDGTLCGPLHTEAAITAFETAIQKVPIQGGKIRYGGQRITDRPGNFVVPAIAEMPVDAPMVQEELFGPLLYTMKFKTTSEAIKLNNDAPQSLSSCIFTKNARTQQIWLGAVGSDCGIANVNIGTSGAEIGAGFGAGAPGKESGIGAESGGTAWMQYGRRQTSTINFSNELPLAQGITFDVSSSIEQNPKYATHPAFDM
jgi:aldehyde dehydrogenase family 7 protein A1